METVAPQEINASDTDPFDKADLVRLATMEMPFGKYQGRVLIKLPEAYLLWFARKGFPNGQLGRLMALALGLKIDGLESLVWPLINDDK